MSEKDTKLAKEWFDHKFNARAYQYPCTYCGDAPEPKESDHEANVEGLTALLDQKDAEWERVVVEALDGRISGADTLDEIRKRMRVKP